MDEPKAKKKAEGKAREREREKQSKSSKGSQGFGLVDLKNAMGQSFDWDVFIDTSFHQIETWFLCVNLAFLFISYPLKKTVQIFLELE